MIVLLKTVGFTLDEINNMTMAQLKLYANEASKREEKLFKMDVLSCLYGSRAEADDVDKVLARSP